MAVTVLDVSSGSVTLQAPLAPNINHRDTVFGGSAAAVATLAAWSLLHTRLLAEGLSVLPIAGEFTANSVLDEAQWPLFLRQLQRRGRARITVVAELLHAGQMAGRFTGDFVAINTSA
jgi:thioesterase domain-containing protein